LIRVFGEAGVVKCFWPKGRDPKNLDSNEIKKLIDRLDS